MTFVKNQGNPWTWDQLIQLAEKCSPKNWPQDGCLLSQNPGGDRYVFPTQQRFGDTFFLVGKRRASWDFRTFNFVTLSHIPSRSWPKGRFPMGSDDGIKFFFSRSGSFFFSWFPAATTFQLQTWNMSTCYAMRFFSQAKKTKRCRDGRLIQQQGLPCIGDPSYPWQAASSSSSVTRLRYQATWWSDLLGKRDRLHMNFRTKNWDLPRKLPKTPQAQWSSGFVFEDHLNY